MTLATPIINERGMTLLGADIILTDAHIKSLKKREIEHIIILAEDSRSEEQLTQERAKITERLLFIFKNSEFDHELSRLHDLVLEYRLQQLEESL